VIEILAPALGLEVFRAGALQTDPSCDGYALVMLRAASLRWPRRRRLARTALSFGMLWPRASLGRYTRAGREFTRWFTYVPREEPGAVLARFENQNGRFKAVATAGGVAVVHDEVMP
jgi:hypothetical protein